MKYGFSHDLTVYHCLPSFENGQYHSHKCTFSVLFVDAFRPLKGRATDMSELIDMEEVYNHLAQTIRGAFNDPHPVWVFGPDSFAPATKLPAMYIKEDLPVFENIVKYFQDQCRFALDNVYLGRIKMVQSEMTVEVTPTSVLKYCNDLTPITDI